MNRMGFILAVELLKFECRRRGRVPENEQEARDWFTEANYPWPPEWNGDTWDAWAHEDGLTKRSAKANISG